MGSLGSDAAIEAADVVLMDDDPAKVATAVKISKKTFWSVRENIIFALGVKFFVLACAQQQDLRRCGRQCLLTWLLQ